MSTIPFRRITYPAHHGGSPVQHKRRRKLPPGYRYDSTNCVISPNGQLLFARREGRKTVYVEGWNVQLYDAMRKLHRTAEQMQAILGRKPHKPNP